MEERWIFVAIVSSPLWIWLLICWIQGEKNGRPEDRF